MPSVSRRVGTTTITNIGNAPLNWAITEDANAAAYIPVTQMHSTLAPGQSAAITVSPDVTQASAGTINAVITVSDSDTGTAVQSQQVAVTIVILAAPILSVTPTSLIGNQSCQPVGGNYACFVTLTNTSQTAGLSWTPNSAAPPPGITLEPTGGILAPGHSKQVGVIIPSTHCAATIIFPDSANTVTITRI